MSATHAHRIIITAFAILSIIVANNAIRAEVKVQDTPSLTPVYQSDTLQIPDTPAGKILRAWLSAHNSADSQTIDEWLATAYNDSLKARMDFAAHLDFYLQSTAMFGKLMQAPVAIVTDEEFNLVVHLVESGYESATELDPLHVVTVEISADPNQPNRLRSGIGLGNLVCAIKEGRDDLLIDGSE